MIGLLGGEWATSLAPREFTVRAADVPPATERIAVQQLLCGAASPTDDVLPRFPRDNFFALLDGQIRVSPAMGPAATRWASKLGECADCKCGCYRLWRPDVRRRFRATVVSLVQEAMAAAATAPRPLRYVTVGSGQLLSDFEILCALCEAGLTIGSVVAVDKHYGAAGDAPSGGAKAGGVPAAKAGDDQTEASAEPTEWERNASSAALAQLAAFFAPARVVAFSSIERYENACALEPRLYSDADAVIQCDAPLDNTAVQGLAAKVLVAGGAFCRLSNLGMGSTTGSDVGAAGGAEHSGSCCGGGSGRPEQKRHRQYWRAQLRESSKIEAFRLSPTTRSLVAVEGSRVAEEAGAKAERHALAKKWLASSMRERAAELGLAIYTVVFDNPSTDPRDKGRHTVAVRAAPSRSASIVSVRHRGDEILVAEERDGWVRLSEHDDDWGWHLASTSKLAAAASASPTGGVDTSQTAAAAAAPGGATPATGRARTQDREGWMLIDGAEVGLGKLLERV